MAYRIEYGTAVPDRYQKKYKPLRLQVMTAAWLLIFVLLVRQYFPAGANKLREYFASATQNPTQQALDGFVRDIHNGIAVGDALFTFCALIISNDPTVAG